MKKKEALSKYKHVLHGITNETMNAILKEFRTANPDAGWGVEVVSEMGVPGPMSIRFSFELRSNTVTAAGQFFAAAARAGVVVE